MTTDTETGRKPATKRERESQNGDFVPPWMADLGLVAGPNGWLNNSKAQLRTMQRPDQTLNVRVWATGMLHAPGYNGQEAMTVRSKNGPKEPLRPSDIVRELFVEAKRYYAGAGIKATDAEWERLKEPREAIRESMSQLEEYGVAQRTDAKGTPFDKLTIKERQCLPSGRTRMFFWLFPRHANPARVRQEWEQFQKRQQPTPPTTSPDDVSTLDVGFSALPIPPIWQILKVFQIEKPEKSLINDPDYQQRVERARVAARAVFLEVVLQALPLAGSEVGPQAPPEVVLPAGALESKVERDAVVQPMRAGSPSATTAPAPRSPSSVHKSNGTSSSSAFSSLATSQKAEEEDRSPYQKFKATYPSDHFDEAKAKPSFESKSEPEQARILARLEVYKSCENWLDRDGRWIPLASNWLKSFEADPPPLLKTEQKGRKELAPVDEVLELLRRNRAAGV